MANKKDKNDYKRPSVYFPTEEENLLKHASQQSDSFASYVRKLIKEDMERENSDKKLKRLVKEAIREYFSENGNMVIAQQVTETIPVNELKTDEVDELMGMRPD